MYYSYTITYDIYKLYTEKNNEINNFPSQYIAEPKLSSRIKFVFDCRTPRAIGWLFAPPESAQIELKV